MDLKKYDLIIFDFDGTIGKLNVDWKQLKIALHNNFFRKYAVKIDFTILSQGFISVYEKFGVEGNSEVDKICYKFESANMDKFKPNQNCLDLISKSQSILVIWSSNQSRVINQVIEYLKIKQKFKLVIGKDSVNKCKPNTDGFAIIQKQFPISKDKILFIGDSAADSGAAKNIGVEFLDIRNI